MDKDKDAETFMPAIKVFMATEDTELAVTRAAEYARIRTFRTG